MELKDELKELFRRWASSSDLTTFKSLILEFPPLHGLNDILDDMSSTPNTKLMKKMNSPRTSVLPKTTSHVKRRSGANAGGSTVKSLKFSPHMFKTEPNANDANTLSPIGVLELVFLMPPMVRERKTMMLLR